LKKRSCQMELKLDITARERLCYYDVMPKFYIFDLYLIFISINVLGRNCWQATRRDLAFSAHAAILRLIFSCWCIVTLGIYLVRDLIFLTFNEQVSPSQFEAHAGWASRRKPWVFICSDLGGLKPLDSVISCNDDWYRSPRFKFLIPRDMILLLLQWWLIIEVQTLIILFCMVWF
jgi:hypothetical protein